MKNILWCLVLGGFLMACTGHTRSGKNNETSQEVRPDSVLSLRYATGFKVEYFKQYKRIIVYNPWKKGVEQQRYYLVKSKNVVVPVDGVRLVIPLKSLVSGSCTHYAFFEQLGLIPFVSGICDVRRTYNPNIRKAVATGKVVDLGDPFKINVERCLMLKPDVLMINSYNQQDENLERLKDSGITVLYNNEWMEPDLLGRAEWIRFIACLFNKEDMADSIFQRVEANYSRLKGIVEWSKDRRPTVLSGDDFRGTWYLPGGRSYAAQLFADAGASYLYRKDTTSGSIPFTFEQVLHDFHSADIWVGMTNAPTLQRLKQLDERYTLFKAYKNRNLWAYTLHSTPQGGNDFWETAVARPDLLLSDYIKVFHPGLLVDLPFHFMKKVP
jgi:iron complex transport system substrate-binding protein